MQQKTTSPNGPRTVLVHDWLVNWGGAESVLVELVKCFPRAPIYVLIDFFDDMQRRQLNASHIVTSFMQNIPGARRNFWYYSALMPAAVERLDLRGYDLVLSDSHSFAKGVLVHPEQLHISYVHSTPRFAWDLQDYYLERFGWNSGPKSCAALAVFHCLRLWDTRTSNGVDLMLCNSDYVRRRIIKTYRWPAFVVYPPIDTERFVLQEKKQDFYLTGSFMNPFKRIDLVVQAFAKMPNSRLVVFGEGPDMPSIRALAGPNVGFVGRLSNERLVEYLRSARAFVFGAPEDFGMIMAEAQSCGTPVLAYAEGGASEIVRDLGTEHPTGVLYGEQTPESLIECIQRFERATTIAAESCRANAMRFSTPRFHSRLGHILDVSWSHWSRNQWPVHEEQLFPLLADG